MPKVKKRRTHSRIVAAASKMFRRDGFQQTSVDALMKEAGLTRGGFYAHFDDKQHLFLEAIEEAFEESKGNLFAKGLEDLRGDAWRDLAGRRYLRGKHRSRPDQGCAITTLGAEVAKAPHEVREVFERNVGEVLSMMTAKLLAGDSSMGEADARRDAIALLSQWVGAMVMARAVVDEELVEEIFDAAQAVG